MLNRSTVDWLAGKFPRMAFLLPSARKRRGSVFMEYALLAALIGIVGAVGLVYFGEQIRDFFKMLGDKTAGVASGK